jgi:hypothetical protein
MNINIDSSVLEDLKKSMESRGKNAVRVDLAGFG